jgi:hypothetical protein
MQRDVMMQSLNSRAQNSTGRYLATDLHTQVPVLRFDWQLFCDPSGCAIADYRQRAHLILGRLNFDSIIHLAKN